MKIRPLSKELQKVAEDELNEVPDRIQEDLKKVREWLATKPNLSVKKENQWLLNYLRNCKFNFEKFKIKLEYYHTKQKENPEFFQNRDPFLPGIQELLRRRIIVILPQTVGLAGPRLILIRSALADPVKVPAVVFVKLLLMLIDIMYMEDDNFVIAGVCFITDLTDLAYKYLLQLTPIHLKKTITCVLNAYSTRLKGGYFINSPAFFQIIFKLLKILLPAKFKNRLTFFDEVEDIYETIPQSVLPKDYGGEGISCDEIADGWKVKVESYRNWFLENELLAEPENDQENVEADLSFGHLEID